METPIGFIGQGWIGKNYADNFEERGYRVVRYALEEPYAQNREAIKECEIVFIAVPTPTTVEGFNANAVEESLHILSPGTKAVVKSTLKPGTTESLQERFPELHIFHSPEFLRERHAREDAAHPKRNIIGVCAQDKETLEFARDVLSVLPPAPYHKIVRAEEAELIKYAGNCFLYQKVIFMNVLYDLADSLNLEWETIREALVQDERIGSSHTEVVHQSGHINGQESKSTRGAGGHCFIKDFEAFKELYKEERGTDAGYEFLDKSAVYNHYLLRSTGKDLDIVREVYGK